MKNSTARGEAEKRIGAPFELFADRASSTTMAANQLRLWFAAIAYVLVNAMRRNRAARHAVCRCLSRHHLSSCSSSGPACASVCDVFSCHHFKLSEPG
jgi:Transposase DDE domain group 1